MDKNYKAGRKPLRLNRAFHNLTEDEELQNKIWQQTRIMEYLNQMPIVQAMIPEIEADDIISYVASLPYYEGWQKIVVSNDRDFMQICDDETVLLRPTKNEFLNINRIVEQTGVHPTNMALARAIIGDASDNLPGVRGVGFKTLSKKLDFLAEDKTYTIDDIVEFCGNVDKTRLKFYESVMENKELIEHNYKMMQLYAPQMSVQSKIKVKESVENFESNFNKTALIKMMRDDGFGELNWSDLKIQLNKINIQYLDKTTK
jgi:5'-3' exonuclease